MTGQADYLRNLDPDNPLGDEPGEALKRTRGMRREGLTKILRELPEITATLGSSMVAQPIAGATGLINAGATLARGGGLDAAVERGVRDIKDTQEALTYEPKSEGAKEGLGYIGDVVEPVAKVLRENVADPVGAVSPAIGAALVALPEAIPGPKGVKAAAGAVGKAAKAAKGAERGVAAAEGAAAPVGAVERAGVTAFGAANDAGNEATQAALRAINAADEGGAPIPGGQNGRNAAFQRARAAARAKLESGAPFESAEAAAHTALRQPSGPAPPTGHERLTARIAADRAARGDAPSETPLPGSTEALQRERMRAAALRGENTPAQWAAAADAPGVERGAGVFAGEDWIAPNPASPGAQLHARLQAVGEARRAFETDPNDFNRLRLRNAEDMLQQHRERRQRTAALREQPDTSSALDQAQAAHNANPTPETEAALQAAVDAFVREDMTRTRPIVDDAGGTDWTPEAPTTRPPTRSVLTPEQEARLPEVDAGGWLGERRNITDAGDPPNAEALDARARVLARRIAGQTYDSHSPEFLDIVAELRRRVGGEPDAPSRQSVLRHQKELPGTARRVDPGWEHQKLIPGLEPLTEAQGRLQAARRLGVKTRILRRGDPAMNRESVMAFYEGGRDNPEMFQYGVDPVRTGEVARHAPLEDYADVYNRRTGADIRIEREGGEPDYDADIDVEDRAMEHGRGEAMRDRYGDYKQEKKTHERGDVPVYNERGDPKKVKTGLDEEGQPIKEKYTAVGGEVIREPRNRHGSGGTIKRRIIESEGGEVMRNERGDIKYESEYDPDAYEQRRQEAYENAEPSEETIRMRAKEGGNIDVSGDPEGELGVYAGSNTGPYGSLLYQTLLNEASHSGTKIGGSSLTDINALRILSNANSNFARTGINPRGLVGTGSGDLPPLPGQRRAHETFAEGPEIWRSESDEALKRAQRAGGAPERMGFDPELGFTLDGAPTTPEALKVEFPKMSPRVKESGVGIKTLMRSAVFDWLRDATPDQAAKVAREWGKKYGPLFGVAPIGLATQDEEGRGFTLQDALREKAEEKTR